MSLSHKQKHLMDIHLRTNTLYDDVGMNTGTYADRLHIVNSIEYVLRMQKDGFCSVDLFLPNCFIMQSDINEFWFKIASIIASSNEIKNWHALEYGKALNNVDRRERYVYTWSLSGDNHYEVYKFYTKILRDTNQHKELIWYFGKTTFRNDDLDDESNTTDNESIDLKTG